MFRVTALLVSATFVLAACEPSPPQVGADGRPLPQVYRIGAKDEQAIPVRVVEAVNSLRAVRGTAPVSENSQLAAAATAHSKDMSSQNRAWHWGSDGSSPLERAARTGYYGTVLGENISETYETEIETLSAWMSVHDTRDVLLNPEATQLGFGWYQEASGKIWWTLVTGR